MTVLSRFAATMLATAVIACAQASDLPDHATVQAALRTIVAEQNGGFGLQMWATLVDRDGTVQVVAMSGTDRGDQWPGSRVISAQKAYTANAFSLPGLALSTANLYSAVQPGGSLFGLQHSNPVDAKTAYDGKAETFGTDKDALVGKRVGGVNVFGGGLGLYNSAGKLVGGIGLSGDSSVADHVIAWKLRKALALDFIPGGISTTGDDNMVIDIADGKSASGWGHPETKAEATTIVNALPTSHPVSKKK
ncbi:MAG TPA: heme-binding protein [Planctomycetota bacterium]|nr:heme-binding protein [Planctomycetota bacterium]